MLCVLSWPHPGATFHCLLTPLTPTRALPLSVPPPHHCALSWCGEVHTQAPHYGSKAGSAPGSAGNRAPGSPIPTASPWGCSHRAWGHSYACWGLRPAGSSQQWEAIHLHPGPQRTTKSFNLLRHLVPQGRTCHRDAPPSANHLLSKTIKW